MESKISFGKLMLEIFSVFPIATKMKSYLFFISWIEDLAHDYGSLCWSNPPTEALCTVWRDFLNIFRTKLKLFLLFFILFLTLLQSLPAFPNWLVPSFIYYCSVGAVSLDFKINTWLCLFHLYLLSWHAHKCWNHSWVEW